MGLFAIQVEKDVAILSRESGILRANIYRPHSTGKFPVIMSMAAYGKDVAFKDLFARGYEELLHLVPGVCSDGSSGKYLTCEAPDPERWVPKGYVIVHIDTRGAAKSPGYLDPFSLQEAHDYYDTIEWAAQQEWSTGKIGLLGVSYYAMIQWRVAALKPPHLAAILPWEGASDIYREFFFSGGIYSNAFAMKTWWPAVVMLQHGSPNSFPDRDSGMPVSTCGTAPLSEALRADNRIDLPRELGRHPLEDKFWKTRNLGLHNIEVPVLSAGNWGGLGLHLRGNIEGFVNAGSKEKWLFMHTGTHFDQFYAPAWLAVQMRFFDHYLKGIENGWENEPKVQLTIRHPDSESLRVENEWPLARTKWTKFYLKTDDKTLDERQPSKSASVSYEALGDGATFVTPPFREETEITGPLVAHLWVSSSTTDMDIFATVQAFAPDGAEVTFNGANDPHAPVTQGWLRVSHRKLDPARSTMYRPWHSHDEIQKLEPGNIYPVDLEIWPTSLVLPAGYCLTLKFQGKDFERALEPGEKPISGSIHHNDHIDRNPLEFAGTNTIVSGAEHESYLLLPIIPPK